MNRKGGELPAITISNGSLKENGKASLSPMSSYQSGDRRLSTISVDSTLGDKQLFSGQEEQLTGCQRFRKRLSIILHTHVALVLVSILGTLDAICVIGQIICDILIMSGKLTDYQEMHVRATDMLVHFIPNFFDNKTDYTTWSFHDVIDHMDNQSQYITNETVFKPLMRSSDRSAEFIAAQEDRDDRYKLLYNMTHSFHVGSMVLLSILLVETFVKIYAMGKSFLHHKLEVFDAFVIIVSWTLDVVFWEGIWGRPDQEGATLLIIILPWRVVRIVNSFVLVIQEKDHVILKVVKQRLRLALRRDRESQAKLDKYRLEVRQLQGLCRKHGANEDAIQACCPAGKRRRSSVFQSLQSLASVALVSAMGSSNNMEKEAVSSSEDEGDNDKPQSPSRRDSVESGGMSFSAAPDHDDTANGHTNRGFSKK